MKTCGLPSPLKRPVRLALKGLAVVAATSGAIQIALGAPGDVDTSALPIAVVCPTNENSYTLELVEQFRAGGQQILKFVFVSGRIMNISILVRDSNSDNPAPLIAVNASSAQGEDLKFFVSHTKIGEGVRRDACSSQPAARQRYAARLKANKELLSQDR